MVMNLLLSLEPSVWVPIGVSIAALTFSIYTHVYMRKRDKRAVKVFQAEHVAAWFTGHSESCVVLNNSSLPVYDAVLTGVAVQGTAPRKGEEVHSFTAQAVFSAIPPGKHQYEGLQLSYGMGVSFRPELAFRDARGVSWVRRADGRLEELHDDPLDHYGIPKPFSYSSLSPLE